MRVGSYDILEMAIENETKKLGESYRELEFSKKSLERTCDLIDMFIDYNDMESLDVHIVNDGDLLFIEICIIGSYFEFVGTANAFMEIMRDSIGVEITSEDDGNLKICFGFRGVWEKVK